ncbi:MAG: hypothetical protein JRJ59_00435, partial [Deltaproteobacteria bacterium]|nr:hypothetical protein [Deltaproteobacteria bacterium]
WVEELKEEAARKYIGGFGLIAGLANEYLPPECHPYAPENVMIMAAGALGGTNAPGTGKIHLGAKMANHRIGAAGGGGNMGFILKHSGYDAVLITGRAAEPVYLKIGPQPELVDAGDLWGRDSIETTEELWSRHIGSSVVANGPAGENLVQMSLALVDNVASLGRGGLGAVMGAKKLKAIVACGGDKIRIFDPARFGEISRRIFEAIVNDPLHERWVNEGIMIGWERWRQSGLSNENWRRVFSDEDAAKIWDKEAWFKNKVQNISCMSCPVADKHLVVLRDGRFAGSRVYMSAFLHLANSIGVQLKLTDFEEIVKAFDTCNRLGIDHFSFPALLNFAAELYEKGLLTDKDTDGLELKIEFDTALEMMRRIARRENIGDILADGWLEGPPRISPEAVKYAHHIKGIDPMQDARNIFGTEHLGFVTNPRGAHIAAGESPSTVAGRSLRSFLRYADNIEIPEESQAQIFSEDGFNTGRLLKWAEDHYSFFSSLGVCARQQIAQRYTLEDLASLYRYATGLDMSSHDLHRAGERIWNVYKILNIRAGFRERDVYPEVWFKPIEDKGQRRVMMDYFKKREISREEAQHLLDDYYDERDWSATDAVPFKDKLVELDLADMTGYGTDRPPAQAD